MWVCVYVTASVLNICYVLSQHSLYTIKFASNVNVTSVLLNTENDEPLTLKAIRCLGLLLISNKMKTLDGDIPYVVRFVPVSCVKRLMILYTALRVWVFTGIWSHTVLDFPLPLTSRVCVKWINVVLTLVVIPFLFNWNQASLHI